MIYDDWLWATTVNCTNIIFGTEVPPDDVTEENPNPTLKTTTDICEVNGRELTIPISKKEGDLTSEDWTKVKLKFWIGLTNP